MGAVRGWLLGVVAASLLCALANALMPPGPVKRVGRLVCALVLLAAILSPLAALDVAGGQRWLEEYAAGLDLRRAELEDTVNEQMKVIIEQEYAAYIVDKAAQMELTCSVRVECRLSEDGLYLPARAEVSGVPEGEGRSQLARLISGDLGIPRSGQIYIEEEEVP